MIMIVFHSVALQCLSHIFGDLYCSSDTCLSYNLLKKVLLKRQTGLIEPLHTINIVITVNALFR